MSAIIADGVRRRKYDERGLPARYIAHVEFERRPDGSRNRASKSFRTEAQAKAWVRLQIAAAAESPATAGQRLDRLTVGKLLEDWYAHGTNVTDWSPSHAANMRRIIDGHLAPLARFPVLKLTVEDADDLLGKLDRRRVSPHTIRQVRNALRAAYTFAQKRRLVPQGHNPASLAWTPTVTRKAPRFIRPEDLGIFVRAVEADWRGPYYLTCALLALRPSEAAGLVWQDVDLASGVVLVRRTLHRVKGIGVVYRSTKTHQERRIVMPASLVARLREHRSALRRGRPKRAVTGEAPVFPGRSGEPLDVHRASTALGPLLDAAELPRVTLYQLRHTGATLRVYGGVPLETVRAELGHSTITMTQRYAQVVESMRQESANVVDALLVAARAVDSKPGGTTGGTRRRRTSSPRPAQTPDLRAIAG